MVPFIGNPRTSKLWGQKADQLVPGSRGEKKALIRKGHKSTLGDNRNVLHHYFTSAYVNVDIC